MVRQQDLEMTANDFGGQSRRCARAVLAVALLFAIGAVALTLSPLHKGNAHKQPRGGNDIALYRAVIDRVAGGEEYYAAAGSEMRARGYPTRSVFNWRTPGLTWLIAALPTRDAPRAILGAIGLVTTLLLTIALFREAGRLAAALGGVLLVGAMMLGILGDSAVMPVVWSGALVAASLAAYSVERNGWGVALGLIALLLRELAGPYCAGALVLALWDRRWKEAGGWLCGLACYAGFYAWHVAAVHAHQLPGDSMHDGSWLQGGGLAMVIALAQVQAYLLVLPQWVAAIYFAVAMLGAASARSAWTNRVALTLAGYVLLFGVVGYDFNQYWGVLTAPLLAIAAALCPRAIVELISASRRTPGLTVGAIGSNAPVG